jgi:DNA polymerase-3 subunit epsilon
MREIVFDTETTGLRPEEGERLIEIGAVELENRFLTGRNFHVYLNPEGRAVHPDAQRIHGIEDKFLADKPTFREIADRFLEFIGEATVVAHNAAFDMGFLNAELSRLGAEPFPGDRVIDTLLIARRKHPAGPNSLDALCQRYGVDNSGRVRHGALLDAELLAEVYIELTGGRQSSLLAALGAEARPTLAGGAAATGRPDFLSSRPAPMPPAQTPAEEAAHAEFVAGLSKSPLWKKYGV